MVVRTATRRNKDGTAVRDLQLVHNEWDPAPSAIGAAEEPLGKLRVRAPAAQAERLVAWAAAWPERTWAVEGAGGLGHLLA